MAIDENTLLFGRQMVEQGYTDSHPDLFIAAIAALHDLCVVTRNVVEFQKSGIAVFNPFTGLKTQVLE